MHTLSKRVKITRLEVVSGGGAYQAAAAVDGNLVNSTRVDMLGFDSVLFLYLIGTGVNAAVIATKIRQDTATGMGTAQDLAGTAQTITDVGGNHLNQIIATDIHRPTERYVQLTYQRTVQNSAIDAILAIQYNGSFEGITQLLTAGQFAAAPEVFNSPAEGTA